MPSLALPSVQPPNLATPLRMSARPASIASHNTDIVAAEEAHDVFDEQNASFRTSRLPDAIFGSAPRQRSISNPNVKFAGHARRELSSLKSRPASVSIARQSTPGGSALRSNGHSAKDSKDLDRPDSPDIDTILAKTPRPRRAASYNFSPSSSSARSRRPQSTLSFRAPSAGLGSRSPSQRKTSQGESETVDIPDDESIISDYGMLLRNDNGSGPEDLDGSESDSSLDIHTPLPHLMFRDGLLSPRSKLLPQSAPASSFPYLMQDRELMNARAGSVLSIVSTAGSVTTRSGLQKDPRDTERRRVRHRDGSLLRAGMGLTTGLGWSDSEDEDAPSTLTRRLIKTTIDRQRATSISSSRPSTEYSTGDKPMSPRTSTSRFTSPTPLAMKPQPRLRRSTSQKASSISNTRSVYTATSSTTSEPQPIRASTPPSETVAFPIPESPQDILSFKTANNVRQRAESSASTSTSTSTTSTSLTSTPSIYSSSSSTASASSTSTVPRPLRLPQTVGNNSTFNFRASLFSQDAPTVSTSTSGSVSTTVHTIPRSSATTPTARARTLSNPVTMITTTISQPKPLLRTPSKLARPNDQTPVHPPGLTKPSATISSLPNPSSPPRSPPPTMKSDPRVRPTLIGARPQPRTGTGMVYRTSSYSSLQATAAAVARMKSMSAVPASSAGAGSRVPSQMQSPGVPF